MIVVAVMGDARVMTWSLYAGLTGYAVRAYPSIGLMDSGREDPREFDELVSLKAGQEVVALYGRIARFLSTSWFATINDGKVLITVNFCIHDSRLQLTNQLLRSFERPLPAISSWFTCRDEYIPH